MSTDHYLKISSHWRPETHTENFTSPFILQSEIFISHPQILNAGKASWQEGKETLHAEDKDQSGDENMGRHPRQKAQLGRGPAGRFEEDRSPAGAEV